MNNEMVSVPISGFIVLSSKVRAYDCLTDMSLGVQHETMKQP